MITKVLALLSLALVISLSQCTGVCWEVALEPIELPFILSGVYSPSEANYCSNPFEVFLHPVFSRFILYTKLVLNSELLNRFPALIWRLLSNHTVSCQMKFHFISSRISALLSLHIFHKLYQEDWSCQRRRYKRFLLDSFNMHPTMCKNNFRCSKANQELHFWLISSRFPYILQV